jgi:hypothetical protein
LIGKIEHVDIRKQIVTVGFEKEKEEAKVHDPFLG